MNEYDSNRIFDVVEKIGYKKTENQDNGENCWFYKEKCTH